MDLKNTLRRLCEVPGPTGQEQAVADLVRELLAPSCDEVAVDPLFNVIGLRRGQGPEPRPRLMFMAHLDEVHLWVTAVEGEFLRFRADVSDPNLLVGQEVVVLGREKLHGVIGDRPPHMMSRQEARRMPEPNDLVIDLGMTAQQVADMVRVGDVALVHQPMMELLGERVAAKALDNRVGVLTLLAALERLQRLQHPCDILAVASAGEELNLLGAQTVTFSLRPDVAIVLDVTFGVQPNTGNLSTFELGGGPVLGVGPNFHPALVDKLVDVARELEMDHGVEPLPGNSGTDAWMVEISAGGVPVGLISLPIRNMHSQSEVVDLRDVQRAARWLEAFAASVDREFMEGLAYRLPDFDQEGQSVSEAGAGAGDLSKEAK